MQDGNLTVIKLVQPFLFHGILEIRYTHCPLIPNDDIELREQSFSHFEIGVVNGADETQNVYFYAKNFPVVYNLVVKTKVWGEETYFCEVERPF